MVDEEKDPNSPKAHLRRRKAIDMSLTNRLFSLTTSLSSSLALAGLVAAIFSLYSVTVQINGVRQMSEPVQVPRDSYVLIQNSLSQAQDAIERIELSPDFATVSEDTRFNIRDAKRQLASVEMFLKVSEPKSQKSESETGSLFPIITPAYAQEKAEVKVAEPTNPEEIRKNILYSVMAGIALFGFGCLIMYLTTKDQKKMDFADNMLRTIVGFFIGITTGLLGLPSK